MNVARIETTSPRGNAATFWHREGYTDLSTVFGTFSPWGGPCDDEYRLSSVHPRTYLDIGGHIGVIVVAVLLDNPECTATVIEPLPENLALLHRNLAENKVADRATVIAGAIGSRPSQRVGYRLPRVIGAEEVHRWVGSPVDDDYPDEAVSVPTVPLIEGGYDLVKMDCETCEWFALTQPAVLASRRIVGEYHFGGEADAVHALLDPTHDTEVIPHASGGTGMFWADLR